MISLFSERKTKVLFTERRSDAHGTYTYRLLAFTEGLSDGHAMQAVFEGADGYRSEECVTLPFVQRSLAQEFFHGAVRRLVSPLSLPYVLEDACTQ